MGLTQTLRGLCVKYAVLVDDEFIKYLFELIEELSCDSNDPYHYPVIRVLVSVQAEKKKANSKFEEIEPVLIYYYSLF